MKKIMITLFVLLNVSYASAAATNADVQKFRAYCFQQFSQVAQSNATIQRLQANGEISVDEASILKNGAKITEHSLTLTCTSVLGNSEIAAIKANY